jgi:hypothetical protein
MCVLILPWDFHSRRFWGKHHTTILRRLLDEVTERPLSQTECLDTSRVTNQVIFTGDASRSQPGMWGDGEMGNFVSRVAQTNGLLTVFGALHCARDLNEALSDVRESSPFATAASPLLLTNYLSFLLGQNNSLFRTLEQECQEIQGPPHVASRNENGLQGRPKSGYTSASAQVIG